MVCEKGKASAPAPKSSEKNLGGPFKVQGNASYAVGNKAEGTFQSNAPMGNFDRDVASAAEANDARGGGAQVNAQMSGNPADNIAAMLKGFNDGKVN